MAIKKIKVGSTTHDVDAHVALNTNLETLGGSASAGPVFMVKNVSSAGAPYVDYRSMPLNIDWGGTGGSTKLEAANSLDFWSLTEGTSIAANTNLNTLTTPGNYKCANEANVKTLVNGPSDVTNYGYLFTMKVGCLPDNPTYLYQEIITFGHNIHYYRRKPGSSSEWQAWSKNFNTHMVVPLENGGTGSSTSIAGAPKNAIIKKVNEDNGSSLTYTATKKGALYALEEDGVPAFGTLPLECGGTGSASTLANAPDGVFVRKRTDADGDKYLGYSEYVSLANDVSGHLSLANGGTGNTLANAPNNAIIRKGADVNYLWYTATNKGAFYAEAQNGSPKFGTLPLEYGGTGADDRMHAINNLISLPHNTEPTADTTAEWVKFGSFICYYSSDTSVINKPSSYGTLIQIVAPSSTGDLSATTIQQIWMRQGYGYVFTRAGNTTGWNGSADVSGADAWKRCYDSSSIIPIANGGTEASTASGARSNLGFSYATSAPTAAPSTGAGAVCFVVDSGAALPIAEGGTGASTKVNAVKNLGMYPVGSVYITNTSTSPASYLGGTWECFDKQLRGKVFDSTSTSGFWTYNSTNTESDSQVYAYREGHKLHMRFDIHTKVEMGESTYNLGTLDYDAMGFSSFPYSAIYAAATSDGGNAVGYCRLDYSSGILQIVDINPKTDGNLMPAGSWLYLILEMPITSAAMYNDAVDRFYWKRTA